jgi:histidinol-phosphate aminotransferase
MSIKQVKRPKANAHLEVIPDYAVSDTVGDVAERYGLDEVTYLASNENPFGCSPTVTEAMAKAISEVHRYPDGAGRELKKVLASELQVLPVSIVLGNGSNEVLELVAKVFLSSADEMLMSEHSFAMYPIFGLSLGAQVRTVPMCNWFVDLDAMLSAVTNKTKVIYIANANNPTGTMLSFEDLRVFISRLPSHILLVIDEAYVEFSDTKLGFEDHKSGSADTKIGTVVSLVDEYPNLVVSRTFSKAYGIAGLRVGYGIANETVVRLLEKMRQPFNVNAIALSAAIAAFKDQEFLKKVVSHNSLEKTRIKAELNILNVRYLPSQTNFLTIELPTLAKRCSDYLQKNGVIVRSLSSYGMSDWLRVSVGLTNENDLFIRKLKDFLEMPHD